MQRPVWLERGGGGVGVGGGAGCRTDEAESLHPVSLCKDSFCLEEGKQPREAFEHRCDVIELPLSQDYPAYFVKMVYSGQWLPL